MLCLAAMEDAVERPDLFVTKYDMERLRLLVDQEGKDGCPELRTRLISANVVPGGAIPPDVVTMNSNVLVQDMSTGNKRVLRLVFPEDEDFRRGRVSVTRPLGAALLGSRKGDELAWEQEFLRAGFKVKVVDVTDQPERQGRFTAKDEER